MTNRVVLLPSGDYLARVIEATGGNSPAGHNQWDLRFLVVCGPHTGAELHFCLAIVPSSPNAVAILFRTLAALGVTSDILQNEPTMTEVAALMLHKLVWLQAGENGSVMSLRRGSP